MTLSNNILNNGLELHLEFGENWLTDIDDRLSEKFPGLSKYDLRKCDNLCRKTAKIANSFVCNNPIKEKGKVKFIDSSDFKIYMLNQYDWINEKNLSHLYSQSCYYAMK